MNKNDVLSNNERLENACELTATANSLDIIIRLMNDFEYSRVSGDTYSINHQVENGLFDSLGENLTNIKEAIEKVSDAICPDESEGRE